ncbi:MAG: hypothetical protein ACR2L3_03435, partial [Actinomycetota bacterium]
PLAFAVLLLSRAALIVKGAVLPVLVPPGRSLVKANASLSRISALAGIVVGLPGIVIINFVGVNAELLLAAVIYYMATILALRLPTMKGRRAAEERLGAQAMARSAGIRQAILAAGGMRMLVGFVVFHLAFALRREDLGSVGLGLLVGASAFGGLVGALIAPRLRRSLREEGILLASLLAAGLAALVTGRFFTPVAAGILVFVLGVASGASKVAFDSMVQRETPEAGRGWAFARFESVLQLAWVVGAMIPLVFTLPSGPGVVAVGIAANTIAILFTLGRHRTHPPVLPQNQPPYR